MEYIKILEKMSDTNNHRCGSPNGELIRVVLFRKKARHHDFRV